MTERKHVFEEGFEVVTKSDRIQDFKDYLLCYRKEQQHTDKMAYWCLKKDLTENFVTIAFHLAGPINAEGIVESLPLNTQTICSEKKNWVFENYAG